MQNFEAVDCRGDCLQWGGFGVDWGGEWLRPAKNAGLFKLAPSVRLFESPGFFCLQYVLDDGSMRVPVSALVWSKATGEIETVKTLPEFQRKGLARSLLAVGRACVGNIRHSQNQTPEGAAWAARVG